LPIVEIVILALHVIITLPTTIGIVGLFGYQVWCLIGNVTSVETFSRARYRRAALKRGENFTWFYDFGWHSNIKQVLGSSVWEWLIPAMPEHIKIGDGISFNTRGVSDTLSDQIESVEVVISGSSKKRNVTASEEERLIQ